MVMVELAVAGWFVSVCLSKLADPVIQHAKDRYKDQKNFVANTEKLKWRLEQISEAISRAKEREVDDSKLQSWIQRLGDAVFTAEDVLDPIKYAMLKHQRNVRQNSSTSGTDIETDEKL
uniref:Disease resistance N-terminal domain-containing protein n=1 Tax=Aegilops tauschii subsp. strangulata TaxID=200361 RepID=A0A453HP34_AEGTS